MEFMSASIPPSRLRCLCAAESNDEKIKKKKKKGIVRWGRERERGEGAYAGTHW